MPTPSPAEFELLLGASGVDVGYAGAEALPAFERRVAETLGVEPRRVIATLGATGGMHLAAWRFFGPGSRVASETPSYEPLRSLPRALGGECVLVERDPTAGWSLDPARVREALAGSARGHVFMTNSHNPTGALLSGAEVAELAREARRAGGVLVCCEVYLEFAEAERREAAFRVAPNAISISSLTKAFGLGGLRAGWIVLGEGLVGERESLLDLAYLTYVDQPTAALRASCAALGRLGELRVAIERVSRESRPLLHSWLDSTPGIVSSMPALGLTAFPRIEGVTDTRALADFLVEHWDVGIVPGEYFGRPGHVRVGCGEPPGRLQPALERLAAGIADYASRFR